LSTGELYTKTQICTLQIHLFYIYFFNIFIMTNIKKIALATVALMLTTSAFAATGTTTATTTAAPVSASLELKSAPTLVSKTST
jgi:hypothetical protein